jgi:hypothetical protein
MCLAAVMNLMLENMEQQPVEPFVLNVVGAVNVHDALKASLVQFLDNGDQAAVDFRLCHLQGDDSLAGLRVLAEGQAARATLHCVNVKPINDQDMVECGAQAWKKAGARRLEVCLRQTCTGREQAMIGPGVVIGHRSVRQDRIHQCLLRSRFPQKPWFPVNTTNDEAGAVDQV